MNSIFDSHIFTELNKDAIIIDNNSIKIKHTNNMPGLYVIYSDSCYHCISLMPMFVQLKKILINRGLGNSIISGMNIKNNNYIKDILDITYVPLVFIEKTNGELVRFNGNSH